MSVQLDTGYNAFPLRLTWICVTLTRDLSRPPNPTTPNFLIIAIKNFPLGVFQKFVFMYHFNYQNFSTNIRRYMKIIFEIEFLRSFIFRFIWYAFFYCENMVLNSAICAPLNRAKSPKPAWCWLLGYMFSFLKYWQLNEKVCKFLSPRLHVSLAHLILISFNLTALN